MVGSPADRIQNSPKRFLRDRVGTEFLNGPPILNYVNNRRVGWDCFHRVYQLSRVSHIVLVLELISGIPYRPRPRPRKRIFLRAFRTTGRFHLREHAWGLSQLVLLMSPFRGRGRRRERGRLRHFRSMLTLVPPYYSVPKSKTLLIH